MSGTRTWDRHTGPLGSEHPGYADLDREDDPFAPDAADLAGDLPGRPRLADHDPGRDPDALTDDDVWCERHMVTPVELAELRADEPF